MSDLFDWPKLVVGIFVAMAVVVTLGVFLRPVLGTELTSALTFFVGLALGSGAVLWAGR